MARKKAQSFVGVAVTLPGQPLDGGIVTGVDRTGVKGVYSATVYWYVAGNRTLRDPVFGFTSANRLLRLEGTMAERVRAQAAALALTPRRDQWGRGRPWGDP